ncbi:MAG: pyridoxal-phosphate dependent enzyme [Tabrizicola sp.]|uniref:pyridoxal-phosphate dependent enzyme n=1 Tax=Tabrizicola sp. TaxID=2005166 RepID=UPI0027330AF1|nr:pyridoxal-phosphate dependent enzyme [Tabrizicola sp.]MDP3261444.1 pyridoxal-phosphate dependent enzyme [Tabrizicola sp.]MDP3649233.1 pyridoxal-phosphate dependent enzyme [Paracoccaceae bacterium]
MTDIVTASAARSVQARRRIRPHIHETPLIPARNGHGGTLMFKAENFQLTGSFKIRGAASVMTAAASDQPMITASSGNHGIGAARAAQSLGRKLTVVLPESVVPEKLAKIRSYGVEVVLHGAETGLAEQHAQHLARTTGARYVSPYNDADVIAGQGTIGLELLDQAAQIDTVFIAMGGGGLVSGIGAVLKAFSPATRIIGAAAEASQALALSMAAGRVVDCNHDDTLADAVAGGIDPDTLTLPLATAVIDEVVTCSEAEILAALRILAQEENLLVEGAAALALAACLKRGGAVAGKTSVVLLCGGNFDGARLRALVV